LIQQSTERGIAIRKIERKYWLLMVILLIMLISDQATKALVIRYVPEGETIRLVEGYLNLTHVRNQGAAFGILAKAGPWVQRYFFIPISVCASIVILAIIFRAKEVETLKIIALSLVLSGALGNLMDRWRWGAVVDFIDVHYGSLHWPSFNMADASISIGVILLSALLIFDQ
jgi:signal peptidase II